VRELDGIAAAVNDLSQALDAQESLRRRLTEDMAHELRTPLATLQSHLEALIDGVWEPDRTRLTGLHDEILRINRMVLDLENLAAYENRKPALTKLPVDVARLASGIVRNNDPRFGAKGIALTFRGADSAVVPADQDKLSQAIINLLSNSYDFTAPGGTVTLQVAANAEGVAIRVTDTGIGISEKDLPHVFERFYRTDPSRSRTIEHAGQRHARTGGSGIGLSIAKAIIEAHGGTLGAQSAPGNGSTFRIRIPARVKEENDSRF
jgi:signal transduction histidine kinase